MTAFPLHVHKYRKRHSDSVLTFDHCLSPSRAGKELDKPFRIPQVKSQLRMNKLKQFKAAADIEHGHPSFSAISRKKLKQSHHNHGGVIGDDTDGFDHVYEY
ncbi:unnamed protein product [Cuscuta epithymum]|uniref:Uncharacterized protein n=1 Tax=Cuscuta epithymum TaxID=186058 RepID=A0AAV0D8J2_9ASTE|nr:unnamed protein product [Cuscuta epithymum]